MSSLIFIATILSILWVWTLISFLKRTDLSDTDRIVWTIVLCLLSILGMLLYWFLAPVEPAGPGEPARPNRARTEQELKDYFNSRPNKKS